MADQATVVVNEIREAHAIFACLWKPSVVWDGPVVLGQLCIQFRVEPFLRVRRIIQPRILFEFLQNYKKQF